VDWRLVMSNATGESGMQIAADGAEFVPVSVQITPSPRFQVTNDNTPSTMLPGGTAHINLTLKNTSNFTWNAYVSGSTQPVQVIYRWQNAQGQAITTSSPIALSQDVSVGSSVSITATIQAPMQFGTFTMQWDMQQGTTTFSQQGAQTKNDSIQVTPAQHWISPRLWQPR